MRVDGVPASAAKELVTSKPATDATVNLFDVFLLSFLFDAYLLRTS
jgi:hypothetical protein